MSKPLIICILLVTCFALSCKKDDKGNSNDPKPMGNTFIAFTIDGVRYETQGEVLPGSTDNVYTWFVITGANRFDPAYQIGFGMRNTNIDSIPLPYKFKAPVGSSQPNAEIFYLTKEGSEFIIYDLTSNRSDNAIILTEIDRTNMLLKGTFSGTALKLKSDSVYSKTELIKEVSVIDGTFNLSYRK